MNMNINDFIVIKSGYDKRNLSFLKEHGVSKLQRGIYAIARISGKFIDKGEKFISFQVESNFFDNPIDAPNIMQFHSIGTRGPNTRALEKDAIHYFERLFEKAYNANINVIYTEGTRSSIMTSVYERNSFARDKCLEIHGYKCLVCEIDFEETYGKIGQEYIHVHHKVPISSIKESYQINPKDDLVPVCPNCHAMLHKKRPIPYTPEKLKKQMYDKGIIKSLCVVNN